MADRPSPPWLLKCPWCDWNVMVFARGGRGQDHGSGYEAARLGERHAAERHGRTWAEWLAAEERTRITA